MCLLKLTVQLLTFLPSLVQRRDGEPAVTMATQEFEHFMVQVIRKSLKDADDVGPYFSMDNASWHRVGHLKVGKNKLLRDCQVPLPVLSPDLHKIIEHAIHRVKGAMGTWLAQNPRRHSVAELQRQFLKFFHATNQPKTIEKDLKTLRQTFKIVSLPKEKGGTGGGHAPPGLN